MLSKVEPARRTRPERACQAASERFDEVFEALNLRRTQRLEPFPVILVGSSYWNGLRDWLEGTAVAEGPLNVDDLDLLEIMDEPEAAVPRVLECHAELYRSLGIVNHEPR